MHAVDNEWGDHEGDTFYFGWSNDYQSTDDSWGTVMTAPAISVGTAWNNFPGGVQSSPTHSTYGSTNHLYQLWWPDDNTVGSDIPKGIGVGSKVVVSTSGVPYEQALSTVVPFNKVVLTTVQDVVVVVL